MSKIYHGITTDLDNLYGQISKENKDTADQVLEIIKNMSLFPKYFSISISKKLEEIRESVDQNNMERFSGFVNKLKKSIDEITRNGTPNGEKLIKDVITVMEMDLDHQIESLTTERSAIETLNYEREKSTIDSEIAGTQYLKDKLQDFFKMFRNEVYSSGFKPTENYSDTRIEQLEEM